MARKKKLKIALFHLGFMYSGGGERLVIQEAIALAKLGHEVTCYVPFIDEKDCFPDLLKQITVKRFIPKILPKWFPDVELFSILAACIFTPFFFFKFKHYDLYFGANQPGPWIAFCLSKLNNKPYVIYLAQPTRLIHPRLIDQEVGMRIKYGFSFLSFMTMLFRPLIHLFDVQSIRHANIVFANGSYAKGLIDTLYGVASVNCPAGTSIPAPQLASNTLQRRFRGSVRIGKDTIKKPYLLLTNRHFHQKRFEYAIDALQLLKRKRVPLVITGQETEYTRFLMKEYGHDKRLHFVGLLPEHELEKAYHHAAVYVYPAPEEDFGMGIIEAMGYSVPVVAWGNAGPTGIITHGVDGLLATPFALADYAQQIDIVMRNKALYQKIVLASQKKVKEQFTYDVHAFILHTTILTRIKKWKGKKVMRKLHSQERIPRHRSMTNISAYVQQFQYRFLKKR